MKKNKIVIILLLITFMICVSVISFRLGKMNPNQTKKVVNTENLEENAKFKDEYESLNGEKVDDENTYSTVNIYTTVSIKYINLKKLRELLDSNEAIIYIGSSTCPFCRTSIESLLKAMEDLGLNTLYYYNGGIGNKMDENYDEIMNELVEKNIVKVRENGNKSFGMPLIITVKDAEVVSQIRGVTYELTDGQSEHDNINDEQKKIVYDRYYDKLK